MDTGETQQKREDSTISHADDVLAPSRRRPTAEVERRIDEAIQARKDQLNQKEQTVSVLSCGSEPEILGNYEYLDHPADVQLHSWGDTLEKALEQLGIALFGYMTKLSLVDINVSESQAMGASNVQAHAHDLHSLVFAFLQNWLELFHETGFVAREIHVTELDREEWKISSRGLGECFDTTRHVQGAEIKAVTYSNLQVIVQDEDDDDEGSTHPRCDIWVIVDI